jgi:hypothetical protein
VHGPASRVFPPFHWVFLEEKKEKEKRKREIVVVTVRLIPSH